MTTFIDILKGKSTACRSTYSPLLLALYICSVLNFICPHETCGVQFFQDVLPMQSNLRSFVR